MPKRRLIKNAMKAASILLILGFSSTALAAYTRAGSAPVYIQSVYANESGSPFVFVSSTVNAACSGFYLYNITLSPDAQLRNNKMAILLTAQATGKPVILDYYYDASISGWSACFIDGIQLVN